MAIGFLKSGIEKAPHKSIDAATLLPHRALSAIHVSRYHVGLLLVLSLLFNLLIVALGNTIGWVWHFFYSFWFNALHLNGDVLMTHQHIARIFKITLPYLQLPAIGPTQTILAVTALACAVSLALSFALPVNWLPLAYLLRAIVIIQLSAVWYFLLFPAQFPYDLPSYLDSIQGAGFVFMLIVPWLVSLTFGIFEKRIQKTCALTAGLILYFMVAIPLQCLIHAFVIYEFSYLFMPLLYLLFGLFLDVLMFMALYSWAASMLTVRPPQQAIGPVE